MKGLYEFLGYSAPRADRLGVSGEWEVRSQKSPKARAESLMNASPKLAL